MMSIDELQRMLISRRPIIDISDKREELLLLAELAFMGSRHEHMYYYIRKLAEVVGPAERLTLNERKFFGFACYSHIQKKRKSFQYVAKIAADSTGVDQKRTYTANEYLPLIAMEIHTICKDVVKAIDVNFLGPVYGLVRSELSVEPIIFYRTMKGDFLRYLAEVNIGPESLTFRKEAYEAFLSAKRDAGRLPATNPTRLNTVLSLAQFYCEVHQQPFQGYKTARKAVEFAMRDLESTGDAPSQETAEVLERLRDFLSFWERYAN